MNPQAPEQQTTPPSNFPQNPNDIRGPIESANNRLRDDREKQYVDDRVVLENDYHLDLRNIEADRRQALAAAGLNPDGGTPSNYTPS